MLILCSIFYALISSNISAIFKRPIYFLPIFFALIILNIEILSLFKGINAQNLIILGLIESIIAYALWIKKGKPFLYIDLKDFSRKVKESLFEDKSLIVLGLFWLFFMGLSFLLAGFSPVNEPDAQSYHALRALFWAQDGFISHFETADVRCHSMPVNSELFYTWVLSLSKNDCVFGLLQFFSYILLVISSFKIMEIFEIDFKKRIWAIFVFSGFAGVVSQVSSTQTDLCVGSLIVTSIYLVLEYLKEKKLNLLYFSSLVMAIAFGVKSTGVIGSLPVLIWFIIILKKDFLKFFLFLVGNFVVFSSYNYVLNFINYGNFLGAESAIAAHSIHYRNFIEFLIAGISNVIKYSFSILDFSGLAPFYLLSPLYSFFVHLVFNFLHIDPLFNSNGEIPYLNAALAEQTMGLSILGFLALLPSFIKAMFDKKLKPLCIIFIFQVIILSFTIIYYPTSIRFFIAFISIIIPVLTTIYNKKGYRNFISTLTILSLIFTPMLLVQRPFFNITKELRQEKNIKKLTDNIRDVRYKYYFVSKKHILLKDEIKTLGNNTCFGLFLNSGFMAYPIKYMNFKKEAKIDFLVFDKNKNYEKYDYLIFENNIQEITAIKDYIEDKNCKIATFYNKPIGKACLIAPDDFKNFNLYKKVEYKADNFLKKTGNDEDSTFYILKKKQM